jgi:hypothetical protein
MLIPDLNFCPSQIKKQQQKRGVKKIICPTFFKATSITKLKIILVLNWLREILGNLQRIAEHLTFHTAHFLLFVATKR